MSKPYIIGITGGSGSGKTTLIKRLADLRPAKQICIISQDDYYRPRHEQKTDEQGVQNFDLPFSIDDEAFAKDIQRLLDGEIVSRQEYVFNNADATPTTHTFHPAPIIIVEGLFIFYFENIKKLIDLKVFVHAPDYLKIIRRIKRDRMERNYPLDDVLYRYENHVQPAYKKYIEPYLEVADLVINNIDENSIEKGVRVLKGIVTQTSTSG